ncbi:MAG: hypothetical protein LBQ42_09235 [Synergistaceae bacterium]|nr:hypothetical protein [Synergistaceae bacterium]
MNIRGKLRLFLSAFVLFSAFLSAAAPAAAATESESLTERAKNLYSVQDYNHALLLFAKALELDPQNGEAWDYASWCHRYLGNWEQARQGFERAEQLPGALVKWVKAGLGETYLGAGAYESALQSFSQAIELAPEDEELLVRALKGLVFAYACLGDSERVDENMKLLAEKDSAAATAVGAEAASLLENRRKFFASSVEDSVPPQEKSPEEASAEKEPEPEEKPLEASSPAELSDTMERQEQVAKQATVETAEEAVTIWDFTLGEPIQAVMTHLSERGIDVRKAAEPTRLGTQFYTVKLPGESPLPELVRQDADSILYVLEEFQEKLLSVSASVTWRGRENSIRMKEELFKEMSDSLSEKYGPYANLSDNGIFAEAYWVPNDKHFIALETTASLDGQVVLIVNYNDLPGLNVFWENAKQLNEQRQ